MLILIAAAIVAAAVGFALNRKKYPRNLWVLMGATLIDQIGRFLLLPFFALYITDHFGVSMTQVGQLFLIWAVSGTLGGFVSGAIADKVGRKALIIFGLIFSAGTSLFIGFAQDVRLVFGLAALVGFLSDIGGPAQAAMITDLLPKEKHTEGFGIWRVVVNVAAVIGPLLAGALVTQSEHYIRLFITDAATSLLTAFIVLLLIPETKPKPKEGQAPESLAQVTMGYGRVLRDAAFMAFILISILGAIVYSQMNTTMPVYMRDVSQVAPQGYAALLSLNAAMVVGLQFWVTRKLNRFRPMMIMAAGVFFYAVGFGMFGFGEWFTAVARDASGMLNMGGLAIGFQAVGDSLNFVWGNAMASIPSVMLFFGLAVAILTVGEMLAQPTAVAIAARFAPDDMRGRYMAMYNFSWAIPFAIGPLLAGLIWDGIDPHWIWYAAGILGFLCALGYVWLQVGAGRRISKAEAEKVVVVATDPIPSPSPSQGEGG